MGRLRALHHRIAQDSGHHRVALPALQFPQRGFRGPDRSAWRGSASRKASRPIPKRWPSWPPPAKAACAIRSPRSIRRSPAAAPNWTPPKCARCSARSPWNRSRRSPQALAAGDSRSMLEVVDELERNGQNLQHFSRELSRYFRNLLVTRVAGADTRLVAASAAQREKLGAIAGGFSEEDLTRYLQLSLDLFKRSAVLAAAPLPPGDRPGAPGAGRPPAAHRTGAGRSRRRAPRTDAPRRRAHRRRQLRAPRRLRPPWSAPRTGPSPFELDRAKKAGTRPPEPQSSGANALAPQAEAPPMTAGDPRERLHAWLHEKNNAHLADAVENAVPHHHRRRPERRGAEILRAVLQGPRLRGGRPRSLRPAAAHEAHHGRSRRGPGADQPWPRRPKPKPRTKSPAARWPTRKCSASAKSSAAKYAKFATSRSRHVKLPGNMQQMMRQAQQMQEKMQQEIALIKVTPPPAAAWSPSPWTARRTC